MKLDVLAIVAHPDDAELGAGGTLIAHARAGYKTGVCDLTEGQLGSRGTVETRRKEAADSAEILGLSARVNLGMMDFFFYNDEEHQRPIVEIIRHFRPEVVIANALSDRHPDHGKGATLVAHACFLSGLRAFETTYNGEKQEHWRPRQVYHMLQDHYHHPQLVVDVSDVYARKMEAIRAFETQFHKPGDTGPVTPISTADFMDFLDARAREMGRLIGTTYGEGFCTARPPGTKDLLGLL